MNEFITKIKTIAPEKIFSVIIVTVIVILTGKILLHLLNKVASRTHIDLTLKKFMMGASKFVIWAVAIMIIASTLGIHITSIVALASVVSAAFALAASSTLANFFGGILLLATKPFSIGDFVEINGQEGVISEIKLLTTRMEAADYQMITIPNNTMSTSIIINYSIEGKRRLDMKFDVGYDNDIDMVKKALLAAADKCPNLVSRENIFVNVFGYKDSSITYLLRVWCTTEDYWTNYYKLLEDVKREFDKVGVTFVYPYLNVLMKNQ